MSWYGESYGWIKKQQLENPHLSREALRKWCSKNYPFRERSGYAYKAFLKAMRDVFGPTRKLQSQKIEGQSDMLEGGQ